MAGTSALEAVLCAVNILNALFGLVLGPGFCSNKVSAERSEPESREVWSWRSDRFCLDPSSASHSPSSICATGQSRSHMTAWIMDLLWKWSSQVFSQEPWKHFGWSTKRDLQNGSSIPTLRILQHHFWTKLFLSLNLQIKLYLFVYKTRSSTYLFVFRNTNEAFLMVLKMFTGTDTQQKELLGRSGGRATEVLPETFIWCFYLTCFDGAIKWLNTRLSLCRGFTSHFSCHGFWVQRSPSGDGQLFGSRVCFKGPLKTQLLNRIVVHRWHRHGNNFFMKSHWRSKKMYPPPGKPPQRCSAVSLGSHAEDGEARMGWTAGSPSFWPHICTVPHPSY